MKNHQLTKTAFFLEKKGGKLTASQKEYNKLLKDINLKKEEIEQEKAYLDDVLKLYTDEILPIYKNHAGILMKVARAFAGQTEKHASNKEKQDKLRKAIRYLYNVVSELKPLSFDEIDFFDEWCDIGPQIIPMDFKGATGLMSALIESEFGKPMDLSNVDDSEDGHSLFAEKIMEQFGFKYLSELNTGRQPPKPTEIIELYEYLVEQLHAGINLTEDGRLERDDWIRLADHAYEFNDLDALIRLELRCLVTNSDYLERQDQEKINQYITTLTAELKSFEEIHAELYNRNEYGQIKFFINPEKNLTVSKMHVLTYAIRMDFDNPTFTDLDKTVRSNDNAAIMKLAKSMANMD